MSSTSKNFWVGLTILVALIVLGWMIIEFGGYSAGLFLRHDIPISFHGDRADGISNGSGIYYRGVQVGTVKSVALDPEKGVVIEARLSPDKLPPHNVVGRIRSQLIGGTNTLSLELPDHEQPQGLVSANQEIPAEFTGNNVIPKELISLADELRMTSQELRQSHLLENASQLLVSLKVQVDNIGKIITTVSETINDPHTRHDLADILANVHSFSVHLDAIGQSLAKTMDTASNTMSKAQGQVDAIATNLQDRLEQMSKILESIQKITDGMREGKGTVGRLLTDAKLYDSLVDMTRNLNQTISDLKLYIQQVTQEGIHLH